MRLRSAREADWRVSLEVGSLDEDQTERREVTEKAQRK